MYKAERQTKLSLVRAAEYLGMTTDTLRGLHQAGFVRAYESIGSTPIFLRVELDRVKALQHQMPVDPVQENIRNQAEKLTASIQRVQGRLKKLQDICTHPNAVKENKSDTGNWDRSQDSYWRECHCPDCGKRWVEDQ
jgi:hypothetical protein